MDTPSIRCGWRIENGSESMKQIALSVWPLAALAFAIYVAIAYRGNGVLGYGAIFVAVVVGGYALGALGGLPAMLRGASLRRARPGAVVLPSVSSEELAVALRGVAKADGVELAGVPFSLNIVFDDSGVGVWSGIVRTRRFCHFEWSRVAGIDFHSFPGKAWRGVLIRVSSGSAIVGLPFPVFGGGPVGGMTLSRQRIESITSSLSAFQKQSGLR